MRFSIAKLLVAMLLLNILVCLSFAAPSWIGYPLLTLIALIVVPPMILVGVVNTRGPRQAFFLGCMVAGLPHFIIALYTGVVMVISYEDWSWADGEVAWIMQIAHIGGYFLGMLGGLSGFGAYFVLGCGEQHNSSIGKSSPEGKDGLGATSPNEFGAPSMHPLDAETPLVRSPK